VLSYLVEDFIVNAPNPDKEVVRAVLQRLIERYREPHRHYHTLEHIENGLKTYRELHNGFRLSGISFYAWVYHDAVYDSTASDNERQSAIVWMRDALLLGFTVDEAEKGVPLILATDPSVEPISVLNDIDLAELGAEPERFHQNTFNIRKEYDWVSEEQWRTGRTAILRQFLQRPQLYITRAFQEKFTAQAIENLKSALVLLSQ
jgi:predicted metal-dependent HD superfamily phosphohydrolase